MALESDTQLIFDPLEFRDAVLRKIDRAARLAAIQRLLDYIGVTFAGANKNQERIEEMTPLLECAGEGSVAIGVPFRVSLKDAVFLNGLNSHAYDLDDGTNAGIVHLGSPVISTLLPLAEKYGVSGERLLDSIILGYEMAYTLAVSAQPDLKLKGFHATGTCGGVGAAFAAAHLLECDDQRVFDAFSAACVAASGFLFALDDGSELKSYNTAKAALLAITSLQIGLAGYRGPRDPLFGKRGLFPTTCGKTSLKPPIHDGRLAVFKAYTKPYAACRYCHPAIEAAIHLGSENHLDPSSIDEVTVRTYDLAVFGHDHTDFPNSASANMSTPYGVAVGLIAMRAGLREYGREYLESPELAELARKVSVIPDRGYSESFPAMQSADVCVTLSDGRAYSYRVDYPKGEPENPMSFDELVGKFRDLMRFAGLEQAVYQEILEAVLQVEGNVGKLLLAIREAS